MKSLDFFVGTKVRANPTSHSHYCFLDSYYCLICAKIRRNIVLFRLHFIT